MANVSKCCKDCNYENNLYYNDERRCGITRCMCYDGDRERQHPHFKGCPFERNNESIGEKMTETISVSPKTITYIFGECSAGQPDSAGGDMKKSIEIEHNVTLTRVLRPAGKGYQDPVICVTGLVATSQETTTSGGWTIAGWKTVMDFIRGIDDSIRERQKCQEFGMNLRQHLLVGITVESLNADMESIRDFREEIAERAFIVFPGVRVSLLPLDADDYDYPGRCNLIIEAMSWEQVEDVAWIFKKTAACIRRRQRNRYREQNPPACQLCCHRAEDCKKATEQHEWQKRLIQIGTDLRWRHGREAWSGAQ